LRVPIDWFEEGPRNPITVEQIRTPPYRNKLLYIESAIREILAERG